MAQLPSPYSTNGPAPALTVRPILRRCGRSTSRFGLQAARLNSIRRRIAMKVRRLTSALEGLEPRQLFAWVAPSNQEQYMIELLNRARANPPQFAIDFGLSVPLTDASPQAPLAVNGYLTDSAGGH